MSDIRKRVGRKGTTYQVRYPSKSTKSGYAYATFQTRKEAVAFVESGGTRQTSHIPHSEVRTVREATDMWLRICEKEGLNGREPVTPYTLKNYEYRARFINEYGWNKELQEITAPDVVAFRSWLLQKGISRDLAGKVLSSFQSIMKEMTIRGVLPHNVAPGICVRSDARYREPVVVPTKKDVLALLAAADRLANAKNQTIANAWQRRGFNVACVEAGLVEIVEEDGKEIEQPKYRPYDLRHFFASVLIEQKVNLKKIQTLMGHTNIETTLNVYGHLFPDENDDKNEDRGMLNGLLQVSCGKSVAETV